MRPDSLMGELIKDITANNTGMNIVHLCYTKFILHCILDVESGFKGTDLQL